MTLQERFEAVDLAAIDSFVTEGREEDLHLDFKGATAQFSRDDRRNLAEAISGFANSDGGLIVWGVDARPSRDGIDVATAKKEIELLSLFISKLNQYTGDAATPVVDGVVHRRVVIGEDRGFAVTLVPASDSGPHMAKLGVDRYFKRSGSQFLRMEHFEVEDLFGRRKRPVLKPWWRAVVRSRRGDGDIDYQVVLGIENSGRGSARAPFLSVRIEAPYQLGEYGLDGNYNQGLPRLVSGRGSGVVKFGGTAHLVIHPGVVHEVTAVSGRLPAASNSLADLVVHYAICAEDTRMESGVLQIPGAAIVAALRGTSA
jgi:hypothetical protein